MQKVLYQKAGTNTATLSMENKLPVYSKGEELFNAISHIVGGGLGIVFTLIALWLTAKNPTNEKYVGIGLYSFSMIVLYTMSSLYHFLPQGTAKRIFRIFDHCTIFLLIAGTYSPFCLIALWTQPVGKAIFIIEWSIALVGITFNAINMYWKAVKILSQMAYVIMGWIIVLVARSLLQIVSPACFIWLLVGGICYTVGIVFYALGKKKKYMHCIWHVFVLLGSIFQFVSILLLL